MNNEILDDDLQEHSKTQVYNRETAREINRLKININEDVKHIKSARIALIVVAVFTIGIGLVSAFVSGENLEVLIESLIFFIIYIGCVVGIKYNPRVSIIVGLAFFILIWLLTMLISPSNFFSGIIFKVIIIYYLAMGINGAFGLKKKLEKMFNLGAPISEIEKAKSYERLLLDTLPPE